MDDSKKQIKRLYLSDNDYKLAGVCGGIGEYFNIDSVFVRLILIFISLATAILPGIIFYLLAWAIMPRRENEQGSL